MQGFKSIPLQTHYTESKEEKPSGLNNSEGVMELSIKNGNAAERFGLKKGQELNLERKK